MPDAVLTRERILRTAEDVLRRYGPAKTTVVDVARALGVSHGSVYRHFASKTALREAVTQRWLDATHRPLADIADEQGPALDRIHRWIVGLFTAKREKFLEDPELFATYVALVGEDSGIIDAHLEELFAQLERIVRAGIEQGEIAGPDPAETTRALLTATVQFRSPTHSQSWREADAELALEETWRLLERGLRTHP